MDIVTNRTEFNCEDGMISDLPDIFTVKAKTDGRILSLWKRVCYAYNCLDAPVTLCRYREVFMVFARSRDDIRVRSLDPDMKIEDVFSLENVEINPVSELSIEKIAIKY